MFVFNKYLEKQDKNKFMTLIHLGTILATGLNGQHGKS
jgi:hypothetical protein